MSDLLVIRLGRAAGDVVFWARYRDGARAEEGRAESLSALADEPFARDEALKVAGVAPGELAAMRSLGTPPRQRAKLMSAARLLLEDELATRIDDCHVAVWRGEDAARIVAVDKALMTAWTDAFREAGLPLHYLVVDYACLSGSEDRGVLFIEPGRIIADFGGQGFAADADIAKLAIADHFKTNIDALLGVYSARDSLPDNPRYERLGEAGDGPLLDLAAKAIEEDRTVNLMQGEHRPPRRQFLDSKRLRRPAAMAASLAALLLAGAVADGVRASRIAERYESEAQRIHEEAFPGVGNVDIRAHARGVLGAGGGAASFLAISDVLGRALAGHEDVSIDRVRFDSARGLYIVSVRSVSDADIAAFQASLEGLGAMAAETGGYRRAGAFWVGEMTVAL